MIRYFAGVDIGAKGSVCILSSEQKNPVLLKPFPLLSGKPDIFAFGAMLATYPLDNMHVVIEDLKAIFGTSSKSNFSFGWINGATEATLINYQVAYSKVQARKWQARMFEGVRLVQKDTGKKMKDGSPKYKTDTKATALIACQRLFPGVNLRVSEIAKVPNDGICDALLIAQYCKLHY